MNFMQTISTATRLIPLQHYNLLHLWMISKNEMEPFFLMELNPLVKLQAVQLKRSLYFICNMCSFFLILEFNCRVSIKRKKKKNLPMMLSNVCCSSLLSTFSSLDLQTLLLLLLLSRFSRVQLSATPQTASYQAPLSLTPFLKCIDFSVALANVSIISCWIKLPKHF